MKQISIVLSMAVFMVMGACKKPDLPAPTEPVSPSVRFILPSLPGNETGDRQELYVLATILDGNNAEQVVRKKITANGNGAFTSEPFQSGKGLYRIIRFWVSDGNGKVKYAAPVSQSVKAPLVQKPLSISFEVKATGVLEQPVEVLAVTATDRSEHFGYPVGTFNPVAEDRVMVKIRTVVQIGDIMYDSIPAQVGIASWDATGNIFEKDTLLAPGTREIYLDKSHVKYRFRLRKWNITDELILTAAELEAGATYVLGGIKDARRLLREETFLFASGSYRPESKVFYAYTGNKLSQVEFHQRRPQSTELVVTYRDQYQYEGDKVAGILRYEPDGKQVGKTDFFYNADGSRITNVWQESYDQQTGAAISYSLINGSGTVDIDYLFGNGRSMEYKMTFAGGNKTEDRATSQQGGEAGKYKYDFNINPYAHMNMPNLYLSNLSKNNLVEQQKSYGGAIPSAEPYKIEYVYDEEGYPTEAIKHYRNYLTGEFLYKTKTVYTYR